MYQYLIGDWQCLIVTTFKYLRRSPASAFLLLVVLTSTLLAACDPEPEEQTDEYGNPISRSVADPGTPAGNGSPMVLTPPPPPPPGALPKVGGPSTDDSVRPLGPEQLKTFADSLPENQTLLPTFSVGLGLTDAEEAYMVASEIDNRGKTELALTLASASGDRTPLPVDQNTNSWQFYELQALSYQEWTGDEQGPDILVLADYITGVGPEGAAPFTVATVYGYQGNYTYLIDQPTTTQLNSAGVTTLDEAKALLLGESE